MTTTTNKTINRFLGFSKKEDLLNREYVWCETFINDDGEVFGYTKRAERPITENYLVIKTWDGLEKEERKFAIKHTLKERRQKMQSAIDQIDDALKSLEEYDIHDLVL